MKKLIILFIALFSVLTLSAAKDSNYFSISPKDSYNIPDSEWQHYKELGVKTLRIHIQTPCYDIIDGKFVPKTINGQSYNNIFQKARENGIKILLLVTYESYNSEAVTIKSDWGADVNLYLNSWKLIADSIDVNGNPIGNGLIGKVNQYLIDNSFENTVIGWEIWNEENGTWQVAPNKEYITEKTGTVGKNYQTYPWLLCQVYKTLNIPNKTTNIVFGGLDAVGWFDPSGSNPNAATYFKKVYADDQFQAFKTQYNKPPFDVAAIHPYGAQPDDPKSGDYTKFNNNINMIVADTMNYYGDTNIPIYITEIGDYNTDDKLQADWIEYYVKASQNYRDSNGKDRIQGFYLFKYTYPGTTGHALYSIVMEDGRVREGFYRYKDLISELNTNL
jgi:hypothetical protein